MADQREEGNYKIKVVVKTSKKKETIETEPTATIKEFKEAVSSKFGSPVALLCLIFAGRILKDEETLESYSIKDGLTVHLVVKSENRAQQQAAQHASEATHQASSQPASSQPPSSQSPSIQFGHGLGGNIQQMSQQLISNPDLMRQVMDNPMVQSMMSNPDLVREMILSNPQMQQLIERNPEISHILNNPDLMRQTMEMVRNPSLMQEMMRTHDRALSNLESLPGGFNALQRMYTDIQEPMLNATQEQMQNNPFSALFGGGSGSGSGGANPTSNPQQGTENTSPLPNPWVSSSSQASPATQRSRQETNPPPTTASSTASTTANTPGVNPGSTTSSTEQSSPMSGMFQTPAMQSLMQQISGNPDMFQNLMQSPYMQNMMRHMVQNPELMSTIIRSSPMFQGNSQLADQVASRLPEYMTQVQSPELQQAMTNPRVMQALMQIQQGMIQLQTEAPGLVPGGGLMGVPPATVTNTSGSTTATTNTTTAPSGRTSAPSPDPPRPQGGTQEGTQGNPMVQLMSQMMQAMTQTQNPEVTYRVQLDQLAQMGFVDRAQNIQALQATGGDINAAIERLLQ